MSDIWDLIELGSAILKREENKIKRMFAKYRVDVSHSGNSATQFYVKLIFAKFESQKLPFLKFKSPGLWILVNLSGEKLHKSTKIKIQNL